MEELHTYPIFLALARPPMFLGVTVDYFSVTVLITLIFFILFSSALMLLLWLPLHMMGVLLCQQDENFFLVLSAKTRCRVSVNRKLWGVQSYAPY